VYRENLHEDDPLVFILDCQKALISAIQEVCPQINWFLCIWYVQKVVAASCRSSFQGRIELDHTLLLRLSRVRWRLYGMNSKPTSTL
jgi:hypothetical protein